ncbi:MAG: hypothetical protein DRR00_14920 [Candidatus Parabeggiatoa sp. nov. 3]|nr:MAG: hypothetical protein DRR00_14920 [Gammaproteobacteria bacterium]RKZ63837.1 MAG: hypothetical protein DRQ99_16380 [Gammaproteobacteria bacterium]
MIGDEMKTQDEKEIEDWLAILSGRTVPDANPEIILEAQALRMELEARRNPPNPQILKNVFKATGLEPGWRRDLKTIWQKIAELFQSLWQLRLPFPAVAVTVVLLLVIMPVVKPFLTSTPEPNIIAIPKSSLVAQELMVSNPQAEAEALTIGLAKLGIIVSLVKEEAVWIVDVSDLSTDNPDALSTLLEKHRLDRLPPPMVDQLRVHIGGL